jgi:hypothetical protein
MDDLRLPELLAGLSLVTDLGMSLPPRRPYASVWWPRTWLGE